MSKKTFSEFTVEFALNPPKDMVKGSQVVVNLAGHFMRYLDEMKRQFSLHAGEVANAEAIELAIEVGLARSFVDAVLTREFPNDPGEPTAEEDIPHLIDAALRAHKLYSARSAN